MEEKGMNERSGLVTMKGNPLTLTGFEIKVGDKAPDVEVLDNNLSPVRISGFRGKVLIISSVPSLDTPVCDAETRRFDNEISKLGSEVEIITISMDLPFAQIRWCTNSQVKRVKTLSDYREASFGTAYGVLIKELRLLARAVFVLDKEGIVRYTQLVKEVTDEPDYGEVLKAVKKLV
jgi:thiol peroxidase